jgi:hypothetical protein
MAGLTCISHSCGCDEHGLIWTSSAVVDVFWEFWGTFCLHRNSRRAALPCIWKQRPVLRHCTYIPEVSRCFVSFSRHKP